jgi:hypothetical protein
MRAACLTATAVLLAALATNGARADLVTNGGFETETPPGCQIDGGPCALPPPGWLANGGVAVDTAFASAGNYDAVIGTDITGGPGLLQQTFATTPGQAYTIRFVLLDESANPADTLTVSLGGFSATITGDEVSGFTVETFTTAPGDATTTSTELTIAGLNSISGFNVDDVSLVPAAIAVPEPATALLLLAASRPSPAPAASGAARRPRRPAQARVKRYAAIRRTAILSMRSGDAALGQRCPLPTTARTSRQ